MTSKKSTRINARLTAEGARKVAYLRRSQGISATMVVLESIDRYYAAVTERVEAPADILARAGLIACAEGPAELSRDYKTELSRSLRQKA